MVPTLKEAPGTNCSETKLRCIDYLNPRKGSPVSEGRGPLSITLIEQSSIWKEDRWYMSADYPLNTFVIRFWQRSAEDSPGWIGQVQHTQSKECRVFLDITTLQDYFLGFGVVLTSRDSVIYLEAILGAVSRLETFAAEKDFKCFEDSLKTDPSTLWAIDVICLASKRLPLEIFKYLPNIPWHVLDEMRTITTNNLDAFNLQGLWHFVIADIPNIKDRLEQFLSANYPNIG